MSSISSLESAEQIDRTVHNLSCLSLSIADEAIAQVWIFTDIWGVFEVFFIFVTNLIAVEQKRFVAAMRGFFQKCSLDVFWNFQEIFVTENWQNLLNAFLNYVLGTLAAPFTSRSGQ